MTFCKTSTQHDKTPGILRTLFLYVFSGMAGRSSKKRVSTYKERQDILRSKQTKQPLRGYFSFLVWSLVSFSIHSANGKDEHFWNVQKRDINFNIIYTASGPLSDGGQLSVPDFEKEVSETKWMPGILKQLHLPQMCLWGATIFFVQKEFVK